MAPTFRKVEVEGDEDESMRHDCKLRPDVSRTIERRGERRIGRTETRLQIAQKPVRRPVFITYVIIILILVSVLQQLFSTLHTGEWRNVIKQSLLLEPGAVHCEVPA